MIYYFDLWACLAFRPTSCKSFNIFLQVWRVTKSAYVKNNLLWNFWLDAVTFLRIWLSTGGEAAAASDRRKSRKTPEVDG